MTPLAFILAEAAGVDTPAWQIVLALVGGGVGFASSLFFLVLQLIQGRGKSDLAAVRDVAIEIRTEMRSNHDRVERELRALHERDQRIELRLERHIAHSERRREEGKA